MFGFVVAQYAIADFELINFPITFLTFLRKNAQLFEVPMKLFYIVLILIALFGLLAYTNPKLDNYDQFIGQRITEETRKENDPVAGVLGSLFGGFAANLMTKQTARKDYVFFSTYDTVFGNEHIRAIGVLNNFYITESPESKSSE
jgi:RsiW-degrading membrane proteinase PrsW (M82 family)